MCQNVQKVGQVGTKRETQGKAGPNRRKVGCAGKSWESGRQGACQLRFQTRQGRQAAMGISSKTRSDRYGSRKLLPCKASPTRRAITRKPLARLRSPPPRQRPGLASPRRRRRRRAAREPTTRVEWMGGRGSRADCRLNDCGSHDWIAASSGNRLPIGQSCNQSICNLP